MKSYDKKAHGSNKIVIAMGFFDLLGKFSATSY